MPSASFGYLPRGWSFSHSVDLAGERHLSRLNGPMWTLIDEVHCYW
jgi:hypothetical protein